jgi:hypothetical protein
MAFYLDCIKVLNESGSHQLFEQAIMNGVLGRVVMANAMNDGTEPPLSVTKAFSIVLSTLCLRLGGESVPEEWLDLDESEDFATGLRALADRVFVNLQSRLLFITENDLLGLTAYGTELVDAVAVLMGCNVPLVLRSIEHEAREGGVGPFLLVGEAYVHGIMDGEATESAKFVAEELRIR